jgi:hypothetical protein
MSYRLLKQLAHGLALLVLQRWSIWLLLVVVGVEIISGGGGAGGFRTATGFSVSAGTTYTVTVGAGGAAATDKPPNGITRVLILYLAP